MLFYFRRLLPRRAKNRRVNTAGPASVAVAAGHLTLGGKTVTFQLSAVVDAGHLTLAGRTVLATFTLLVDKGSLVLAGRSVILFFETFLPGHLTLAGRSATLGQVVPPSTRAPLLIPSTGNKRATRWRGVPQR